MQRLRGRHKPVIQIAGIGCLALGAALIGAFQANRGTLSAPLDTSTILAQKAARVVSLPKDTMTANYTSSDIRQSNLFQPTPRIMGTIKESEISGIATSQRSKNLFWGLEDSDNGSRLYLYASRNAQLLSTYLLKNIKNDDWEELKSLSDNMGKHYLIIGETGNNIEAPKNFQLFVIEEPRIMHSPKIITLTPRVTTFSFQYPDSPRNCEAFIIDPITHAVYIFSKELYETRVYFSDKFSLNKNRKDTLQFIGALPLAMIVAADISADGNKILLKSYNTIYYWEKESGASLRKTLFEAPQILPYTPIEPEGESICWHGRNYLTLSEKNPAILYKYQCR